MKRTKDPKTRAAFQELIRLAGLETGSKSSYALVGKEGNRPRRSGAYSKSTWDTMTELERAQLNTPHGRGRVERDLKDLKELCGDRSCVGSNDVATLQRDIGSVAAAFTGAQWTRAQATTTRRNQSRLRVPFGSPVMREKSDEPPAPWPNASPAANGKGGA